MLFEVFKIAFIMIILDTIYLSISSSYFNHQIKLVQGSEIRLNFTAAIITYLFLVFGLYYFIIRNNRPLFDASLFGLVIYAVYEFTNKSILAEWKYKTTIIDTVWGMILFTATTYLYRKI
jgi:uncharacterized membrane protein